MYVPWEGFFLEISLFYGTTDTAVLNLERCFTQDFKAEWISLHAMWSICDELNRFTCQLVRGETEKKLSTQLCR